MNKLEVLEAVARSLAAPSRRDAFVFGMPMFLGPRAMVEDPGRRLHWWGFPLPGYDGGPTAAAVRRFEALYYGEASINPFFEACEVAECPICQHPSARTHRMYLSAFDREDVKGWGTWYEGLELL